MNDNYKIYYCLGHGQVQKSNDESSGDIGIKPSWTNSEGFKCGEKYKNELPEQKINTCTEDATMLRQSKGGTGIFLTEIDTRGIVEN